MLVMNCFLIWVTNKRSITPLFSWDGCQQFHHLKLQFGVCGILTRRVGKTLFYSLEEPISNHYSPGSHEIFYCNIFSHFFLPLQNSFQALHPAILSFFNKVAGLSSGLGLLKHLFRHCKEVWKKTEPRFLETVILIL